jgi:uncharacterized membrane protein YcaP (DUF421 family)
LVYLGLFTLLRLLLKRESGTVGITDLLMVVLLADAAQNAMAGEYHSLVDGFFLVGTIVFWSFFLDWIAYHVPAFHRLIHPSPLPLVKDGKLLRRNMRKELITEDELLSHIRQQGIDDIARVKEAFMEGDGQISVIADQEPESRPPKKKNIL